MLKNSFHGFCMALADSVPGVSGGTVAFIMGFYDDFIGSINALAFGKKKEKEKAFRYLIKLLCGWIVGMCLAVLILSALFASHIYIVSSLFIGFIAASIPLVIKEEKESLKNLQGAVFGIVGALLVILITYLNGTITNAAVDLAAFTPFLGIKLFVIGMIAISAMFLPGISGSTLLLIFGAYMPVINGLKALMTLQFNVLPAFVCFGLGIIAGALFVVRLIKVSLEKYRSQMIYLIIGMMVGSFYAIINGPTTLSIPLPALSFSTFNILAAVIGMALVGGMQLLKRHEERKAAVISC